MEYEFSDNDAKIISTAAFRLLAQAFLLLAAGIFGILFYLFSKNLGNLDNIVMLLQSMVEVIIFLSLFMVPKVLKKVYTTEGSDISTLVKGLAKMSQGFKYVWIAVGFNLILDIILIISEV